MKKRKSKIVPHDALIRRLLQEPGYPSELFDTLLPQDLKSELVWDTLQFSKDSFVDEDLSKHFSDAIFDVSLRTRNKDIPIQISIEAISTLYFGLKKDLLAPSIVVKSVT